MSKKLQILKVIEEYVMSSEPIPSDSVLVWMQSTDIDVLGAVADIVIYEQHRRRITPPIEVDRFEAFLFAYYERCLREDPGSEYALSRYGVAHEIHGWFNAVPNDENVNEQMLLIHMKQWLEEVYKNSDSNIRLTIITGALEHILEEPRWREFFANWETDPILLGAYTEALTWAREHEHINDFLS